MGAGFYILDTGVQTIGRGNAFVVKADDLSAVYLNPAGIAKIKGTNFKVESVWGVSNISFKREPWDKPITNKNPGDILPYAGISTDFGLKRWTFAISGYGPYGIATYYNKTGVQRYSMVDQLTVSPYIQFTTACRPVDWLYVGAGVVMVGFTKLDHYAYSMLGDDNVKYDAIAKFTATSFNTFTAKRSNPRRF